MENDPATDKATKALAKISASAPSGPALASHHTAKSENQCCLDYSSSGSAPLRQEVTHLVR
jgi:hypothetical protein